MSVGDIKNNLHKLRFQLQAIKYGKDVDFNSISKGVAEAFLPIYHYIFLEYSLPVAEEIANMDFDLSGKTDLRFVETMYKVLRDIFAYKPVINKDQFFSNGFAERKIIMCSDVIHLVKAKEKTLVEKSAKPRQRSAQTAKLGPRPIAVSKPVAPKETQIINSVIDAAAKLPPVISGAHTANSGPTVHVVNEIHHTLNSCIPPASRSDLNMPHPTMTQCEKSSTEPEYVSVGSPLLAPDNEPIKFEAKVIRENGIAQKQGSPVAWDGLKVVQASDSYNPSRYRAITDGPPQASQPRPVANISRAAETQRCVKDNQILPSSNESNTGNELMKSIKSVEKSVLGLGSIVTSLQSRLSTIEKLVTQQQDQHKEVDEMKPDQVTTRELETLTARITLLENKVTLLDTQVKSLKNISEHHSKNPSHLHEERSAVLT